MKEYTYNSAIDWLIFLYLFSSLPPPPHTHTHTNIYNTVLLTVLGGGTTSFIKFKIPNKVYGKYVPQILPPPSDTQQQMIFKFLLCHFI